MKKVYIMPLVSLIFLLSALATVSCSSRHVAEKPDTTIPTIRSVSPASGATAVAITTVVTCTFSEAMNASTINAASFLLVSVSSTTTTTVAGQVTYNAASHIATFTPNSPLEHNTNYTVIITTDATDIAGNNISSSNSWSFTTIPAPGALDTTFGSGGKIRTALGFSDDETFAAAIQSDGRIITAGLSTSLSGTDYFTVARFLTNGVLDPNFNTTFSPGKNSYFTGRAFAVALQSDDKIVAAGSSGATLSSSADILIARYNADGSRDTTFGNGSTLNGSSTVDMGGIWESARALAIQTDGNIIVVGESTTNNGTTYQTVIARLNTNGTLYSIFDSNTYTTSHAYLVKIQPDEKILIGGIFKNVDENTPGLTSSYLMRYDKAGTLDPSFGTGGVITISTGTNTVIDAMEILPEEGKIIIAGTTKNSTNSTNDLFLMRFNSNGSPDTTFGSNGIVTTDDVDQGEEIAAGFALQSNGKIVFAATYLPPPGPSQTYNFALFRYSADGVLDNTFGVDGFGMVTTDFGSSDYAACVQIQQDGKIVIVGSVWNGSNYDIGLARYWP